MKIFSAFFVVLLASLPGSAQTSEATSLPTGNKPNIVYILADDLGYGELGAYGQELIETPNIDALAREGMRFTQHYSGAPVCAPARCVLMTGLHTGHAGRVLQFADVQIGPGDWLYADADGMLVSAKRLHP